MLGDIWKKITKIPTKITDYHEERKRKEIEEIFSDYKRQLSDDFKHPNSAQLLEIRTNSFRDFIREHPNYAEQAHKVLSDATERFNEVKKMPSKLADKINETLAEFDKTHNELKASQSLNVDHTPAVL